MECIAGSDDNYYNIENPFLPPSSCRYWLLFRDHGHCCFYSCANFLRAPAWSTCRYILGFSTCKHFITMTLIITCTLCLYLFWILSWHHFLGKKQLLSWKCMGIKIL